MEKFSQNGEFEQTLAMLQYPENLLEPLEAGVVKDLQAQIATAKINMALMFYRLYQQVNPTIYNPKNQSNPNLSFNLCELPEKNKKN